MSKPILVDLFAEDRAHEEWIKPLIERIAREEGRAVELRIRSARGGHGKAIAELKFYQRAFAKGLGGETPSLLVVAIDGNCKGHAAAQATIREALDDAFAPLAILATPDPHIERWFLADSKAFHDVIGITPSVISDKCERGYYKQVLAKAIEDAAHPAMLGGIEFARDLVQALDYFRAGKADSSLKHFVDNLRGQLRTLAN